MSHYNQNSSNSWQNRSNTSNSNSFNSLQSHNDLISAAAAAVASSNLNHQQHMVGGHNQNNNGGIVNTGPGIFSTPATLLAQFAQANKVNFNNLAANLPSLVANSNVIQMQNTPPSNANTNNYQWHSSRLNSNNNSSQNGGGNHSNLINNNTGSNNNGRSSYNNNNVVNNNKNSSNNSIINSAFPSLMDVNSKNQPQNSKSSSNRTNNNSSSSSNVNGRLNSSNNNTLNNNNNNNNNSNNNKNNNNNNVTGLALSNPIAQALLNQLASSGGNQANTAIVAAALALTQQNNNNNNNNGSSLLPPPTSSSSSNIRNVITKSSNNNNNNNNNNDRRAASRSQNRSRSPQSSSSSNRNNRNNSSSSSNVNDKNSNNNNSSGDRRSISISKTSDRITITSSNNSNNNNNNRSTSKRKTKSRSPPNYSSSSSKPKAHATPSSNSGGGTGTSTTTTSNSNYTKNNYSSSSGGGGGSGNSSSSSKRYSIRVPKYSLDYATDNVTGLKNRYTDLYIPSDFTNSKNTWVNSLPLNRPLKFTSRCLFHIMNKEAHCAEVNNAIFDAPDADHTWTVKVMLLAMPNISELVKRTCSLAEDNFKDDRFEHPSKVIQFLVGNKGKHELMALGGAWSKSLDGPDPATNTQTLINTAIRTVKALTGIDLTPCTQWFRFLDIQYNRNEEVRTIELNENLAKHNESTTVEVAAAITTTAPDDVDANDSTGITNSTSSLPSSQSNLAYKAALDLNDDIDIETTVIFVPNIWSLMPNSIEYQQIVEAYKNFIENPPIEEEKEEEEEQKMDEEQTTVHAEQDNVKGEPNLDAENQMDVPQGGDEELVKKESDADNDLTNQDNLKQDSEASKPLKIENESAENMDDPLTLNSLMQSASDEIKTEPTHYSKLDVKKMKVDDLRNELEARGLDTKGLKAQLSVRLSKAIQKEKEADGIDPQSSDAKETNNQSQDANESTSSNNNINNSSNLNYDENEDNIIQLEPNDLEKQNELSLNPSEDESDRHDVIEDSIKKAVNTIEAAAEALSTNLNGAPDSTNKHTTSTQKTKEPVKPKKPKLTKTDLERLYKLPEAPHIVVHPSKTAKSGKFECKMVSLSHLLSYHKEDNKESSFEVSLFAEYFNEMLIRDFGFSIYKHIISVKEDNTATSSASSSTNKRKLSVSNENSADTTDSDIKKPKTSEDETETKDTTTSTTNAAASKADSASSSVPSTKISLAMIKTKAKTIFPEILLAFTFFDLNRTNHVYEKDLEDLLLCIGLSLSRSKIRSILKKFKFKDGLMNYRSLTDKVVPISAAVAPIRQSLIYYKVPSDDEIVGLTVNYDGYISRLIKGEKSECNDGLNVNNNNGVVELNGITIDVMNTVKKLENSELYALTLDQKLKESLEEIERLKIINRNAERQKLKLTDETNDYKKRLREQQRLNKETSDKYVKYKDFVNKTFKSHVRELYDDYEDLLGREKSHSSSQKNNNSTSASNTKTSESATVVNDLSIKNTTEIKTVEVSKNTSSQMSNSENAANTQNDLAENGDPDSRDDLVDRESENVENGEANGVDSVADTNKEMMEDETIA